MIDKNMKKSGVFEIVKKGFVGLYNNPVILIPSIAVLLSVWTGMFLGMVVYASGLNLVSQVLLYTIIGLLVLVGIFYFGLGAMGIAKDIADRKRPKLKAVHSYWKKFWDRYIGVSFLIFLIIAGIAAVIVLLSAMASSFGEQAQWIVFGILVLIGLLVGVLLVLPTYTLLVENKNVMKSLKKGIDIAKKNYLYLLGVLVIFFVLSIVLGNIPYVGALLNMIIGAAQTIALMIFVIERS